MKSKQTTLSGVSRKATAGTRKIKKMVKGYTRKITKTTQHVKTHAQRYNVRR